MRALPLERVNAALSLGATRGQLFTHIVLPSALPEILTGIRIALGVGWGTLVAAELIASTRGIGYMIMSASHFLATDAVFVGIGVIAALAFSSSPWPCAWPSGCWCRGRESTEWQPGCRQPTTCGLGLAIGCELD